MVMKSCRFTGLRQLSSSQTIRKSISSNFA